MIRMAVLFIQIAILVFAGVWLANEPGVVTVVWRDWRVDTAIGVIALVLGIVAIMAVVLSRLWDMLRHGPLRLLSSHRVNRERRGYRELTQGMISLAAGDAAGALRHARKADTLLDNPIAGNLLIAQAATLQGKTNLAKQHYEVMSDSGDAAIAGLRGLFEQAISAGDHDSALRFGEKVRELQPDSEWVLLPLFELNVARNDWAGADDVLAEAIRRKVVTAETGKRDRALVLYERGISDLEQGDVGAATSYLREAHDLNPHFVPAATDYARLLADAGKKRRARRVLEQSWERNPHPLSAEAYLDTLQLDNPLDRFKAVQKFVSGDAERTEALLLTAEFAVKAQLWGEARRQLKSLLQQNPSAAVYRMMAELEELDDGNSDRATRWRDAASGAIGDKVWLCSGCGAQRANWKTCCDECGKFGSFQWRHPCAIPSPNTLAGNAVLPLIGKTES